MKKIATVAKVEASGVFAAERRDQHQAGDEKDRDSGEGGGERGHVGKSL